jgi:hypothetical protein
MLKCDGLRQNPVGPTRQSAMLTHSLRCDGVARQNALVCAKPRWLNMSKCDGRDYQHYFLKLGKTQFMGKNTEHRMRFKHAVIE